MVKILKTRVLFTVWKNMDKIVATSTKRNAITRVISKFWVISPLFRMMDNGRNFIKYLVAVLAYKIIPNQASVSPFPVKSITTACPSKSFSSFSFTLLGISRFVRTISRAKTSFIGVILVAPKRFSAFLTVFIESSLSHKYNYTGQTI